MRKQIVNKVLSAFLVPVALIFLPAGDLFAQDESGEREILQRQIRLSDQLLQETANKAEKTVGDLALLSRQISLRERLLNVLSREIVEQENDINELNDIICHMQEDIDMIREQYKETARITYSSFNQDNFFLSLLSSESLSEAYYRAVYFRQFSRYRQQQISIIEQSQKFLANKRQELEESMMEKEILFDEKRMEISMLHLAKGKQQNLYAGLRMREKSYRRNASMYKSRLKSQIQKTESAPVAQQAALLTSAEASTEIDYAKAFEKNKGALSWPVPASKGMIIGKYGKTEDPFGNTINNDGIYIRTPEGEPILAVHKGKVTGVKKLPMNGGVIIIVEHGDYRTVYANLESSYVVEGDMVNRDQKLGIVRTDKRTGESVLNFLIYKYPDKFVNPERWMTRQQ